LVVYLLSPGTSGTDSAKRGIITTMPDTDLALTTYRGHGCSLMLKNLRLSRSSSTKALTRKLCCFAAINWTRFRWSLLSYVLAYIGIVVRSLFANSYTLQGALVAGAAIGMDASTRHDRSKLCRKRLVQRSTCQGPPCRLLHLPSAKNVWVSPGIRGDTSLAH
jgi:hypothetical protein